MPLNHQALAKAMRERREELGLSRPEACRISRKVDVEEYDGDQRAYPGVSERQWGSLEAGDDGTPRHSTLRCVDAALRWPEGTANAILRGLDLPDGIPVLERRQGVHSGRAPTRSEFEHSRAEIGQLRAEVADLVERVDAIQNALDRFLQATN